MTLRQSWTQHSNQPPNAPTSHDEDDDDDNDEDKDNDDNKDDDNGATMLDPAFKSAALPMQTGALTLPVIINIVLITITMVMIIITISGDNVGSSIQASGPPFLIIRSCLFFCQVNMQTIGHLQ